MQPQGHVQVVCVFVCVCVCTCLHTCTCIQVLLNMIDHGMDPQSALDAPRFCIGPGHTGAVGNISFEDGISHDTIAELRSLGHRVTRCSPVKGATERALFGRGQVICSRPVCGGEKESNIVWWCGSDGRGDGMAIGF